MSTDSSPIGQELRVAGTRRDLAASIRGTALGFGACAICAALGLLLTAAVFGAVR